MEKEVDVLFNEDILKIGAELFMLDYSTLEKLGSFENYVFSAQRKGEEFILRFTHSSHRSKQQVEAELTWLQYLQDQHAPVCGPISSQNGHLVEAIPAGKTFFFISLFEKAKGTAVKIDGPLFNEKLFEAWGRATGILHRLSNGYVEPNGIIKRPDSVEEFIQFAPFISADDAKVKEKVTSILLAIKNLPKDKERYRLIHSDIHPGNFFYDEANITIFDFDDSSYHHLIADIAIPIYYSLWFNNKVINKEKFINEEFLPAFMKGYVKENLISLTLLNDIELFLKLRDCELYGVLHKKWDLASLNEKQKKILDDIRERIISDTPIVSVQLEGIFR